MSTKKNAAPTENKKDLNEAFEGAEDAATSLPAERVETGTVAPLPVATGGEEDGAKVVRKITSQSFAGKITQNLIPEHQGTVRWLGVVYGVCTNIDVDTTQYGDFLRLFGDFISESHITGEVSSAGQAILPNIAETVIRAWLPPEAIGRDGKGPRINPPLEMGMEIGLEAAKPELITQEDGSHITKKTYVWTVRPVGARRETPAVRLRAQLKAALKARQAASLEGPGEVKAIGDETEKA